MGKGLFFGMCQQAANSLVRIFAWGFSSNTTAIESVSGLKKASFGAWWHQVLLLEDNSIITLGDNGNGQLMMNDNSVRTGLQYPLLSNIKEVTCAPQSTFCLLNDNTVKCAGDNSYGQLCMGNKTNYNGVIQTPPISDVKQIACGQNHTLILFNDGTIKAVGYNEFGQLGLGNENYEYNTLQTVSISNVKQICCFGDSTIFVLNDGTALACGSNYAGQLGLGTLTDWETTLQEVSITNIDKVFGAAASTIFLLNDKTIRTCGSKSQFNIFCEQLPDYDEYETEIFDATIYSPDIGNVIDIDISSVGSIAILDDYSVIACGGTISDYCDYDQDNPRHYNMILPFKSTEVIANNSQILIKAIEKYVLVAIGHYYNWYAVNDPRSIAGDGWHVPSDSELSAFRTYLSGLSEGIMSKHPFDWVGVGNYGITPTNIYKFNARDDGYRDDHLGMFMLNSYFCLWSSTEYNGSNAYYYEIAVNINSLTRLNENKNRGHSIRLVKDTTNLSNGESGIYVGNDGKNYRTICINGQEWLADNLCETKYKNGNSIDLITVNSNWIGLTTGAYGYYDNDPTRVFFK